GQEGDALVHPLLGLERDLVDGHGTPRSVSKDSGPRTRDWGLRIESAATRPPLQYRRTGVVLTPRARSFPASPQSRVLSPPSRQARLDGLGLGEVETQVPMGS